MSKTGKIIVTVGSILIIVGSAFILAGHFGGANPKMDSNSLAARIVNKIEREAKEELDDDYDDYDDDYDDYDNDEVDNFSESDHENHKENHMKKQGEIQEVEISVGARNLIVKTGNVDTISYEGAMKQDNIYQKGNTFYFVDRSKNSNRKEQEQKTIITLPEKEYQKVDIEVGVANAEIYDIMAKELSIEVEAGTVESSGLVAQKEAEINVGAGKFSGNKLQLHNADIECGLGIIKLNGEIYGKSNLECGMGDLTLQLKGKREDYHIEAEEGMGKVRIDKGKKMKFIDEQYSDSYKGKKGSFSIECGMGNLEVNFDENL